VKTYTIVHPYDDEQTERPTPSRRLVRERVMQALYAREVGRDVGGESIEVLASHIVYPSFAMSEELRSFAESLLIRVTNTERESDALIATLAENWEMHRIAPMDRVLLRMGIVEILMFEEIPTKVTINEIIEIAKRYSTPKSGTFINGMLDAALERLAAEGRINKTGRGLLASGQG